MNGKLKSESIFNNTMKIKEIQYEYQIKNFDRIKAYTAKVSKTFHFENDVDIRIFVSVGGSKYYFLSAWSVLSKKTEIDYPSAGTEINKVTDYKYEELSSKQLSSKIVVFHLKT